MSAADWDLWSALPGKPKRDIVATDGQKLTLGDDADALSDARHTLGMIRR